VELRRCNITTREGASRAFARPTGRLHPEVFDNDKLKKALHDAVQKAIVNVTTGPQALAIAEAVQVLGSPEDLVGTLRSVIDGIAGSNAAIGALLDPVEVAALVKAFALVAPPKQLATISAAALRNANN
jgi:hypothetical protein